MVLHMKNLSSLEGLIVLLREVVIQEGFHEKMVSSYYTSLIRMYGGD